uniref:Uncharacterized protein n=1 Tax=Triticum urartu TaxID=4572 RepID=A0A8R7JXK9_TRIUA
MSAAVPCSLLSSSVSSHLAHPPISLSPGRTGACHGLGSAPPSPENVARHRFFDHNYRIKLPRLRSTRSRPPQPRLVIGRAERRWPRWLPDCRAPPAKDPPASRPPPRHPHLAGDLLQVWPPSKQYAETEAKDDRQLMEEDTSNQSGKLSSFSSGSNAKYCS